MEGFEGGGRIQETSNSQDINNLGANSTEHAVFDASQYTFFGNDVVEEVELGGLEDEEDDFPTTAVDNGEYPSDREEGEVLGSLSEFDDLASTFSKLNNAVGGSSRGAICGRVSRESSIATEWIEEADFPSWFNKQIPEAEGTLEGQRWSSQPYSAGAHVAESNPLYRTSSYPEQQHQLQHQQQQPHKIFSNEPILVPGSSFTSYPHPGGGSQQASPNYYSHHSEFPYQPRGHPMPLSSSSAFSNSPPQFPTLPHGSHFGGVLPQHTPPGLSVNGRSLNQWVSQTGTPPEDQSSLMNGLLQQQFYPRNGLMTRHLMPHQLSQQHRLRPAVQPSFSHLSEMQSHLSNPHVSPAPQMNKFEVVLGLPDLRDQIPKLIPEGRLGSRHPQQGSDIRGWKSDNRWPQFRSRYMSADEIETIIRMQLAATHSNDPYVDDYYHQACLAKKTAGVKLRHHFCPTHLRDQPPQARVDSEPHAFLQVDALGRVAFASIRRPRPLLEVDPPSSSGAGINEQIMLEKPLEQEPMLAARVTIEDGLYVLLDVADIDRFLEFNQLHDGGAQLKRKRQMLLEELATSLHLVDPLSKSGHMVDLDPKDDHVFLRLVSLAKGRKLLSRYLQLLFPVDELAGIVCMAIFRHLRFFFGSFPSDPGAAKATINLARAVSSCVFGMELKALAACLASVICSAEHPPLRPIGSSAGDGASIIVKSVLERATELLTDPKASGNCSMPNRAFWQASFDAFFSHLSKYCINKYDTVMQSLVVHNSSDAAAISADAAKAIRREMPVELLRASLPHTDENQRKLLLDFAQRSMPVLGLSSHSRGNGGT